MIRNCEMVRQSEKVFSIFNRNDERPYSTIELSKVLFVDWARFTAFVYCHVVECRATHLVAVTDTVIKYRLNPYF